MLSSTFGHFDKFSVFYYLGDRPVGFWVCSMTWICSVHPCTIGMSTCLLRPALHHSQMTLVLSLHSCWCSVCRGCSDVLRGNLTNEAYAEHLKSLGLRFSCKTLSEDVSVERRLQSVLGISASYAANIAHASGLASSAKAAKESADHTPEPDFGPKAAKETDADSNMKMGEQMPDNGGAEQMDVDSDYEEPAGVAMMRPQLHAGFSLYVWQSCKSTHRSQCLHVHVKGHCERCNANRVLNDFAMLRAFLQKHGLCRCACILSTHLSFY